MKKVLICGLSAALLLALVLVACNKPQADKPTEPDPTPPAVQTQPMETPAAEPTAKVDEAQPMTARTNLTQKELIGYFEAAYDAGQIYAGIGYDEDSLIEQELKELGYFIEDGTSNWPDDVNVQYLTWRILNHSQEPEATEAPSSNPQPEMTIITGGSGSTTQTDTGTGDNSGGGGNVDTGGTDAYDESHHIDPTQSSVFTKPDDPWDNPGVHLKGYGGTGG